MLKITNPTKCELTVNHLNSYKTKQLRNCDIKRLLWGASQLQEPQHTVTSTLILSTGVQTKAKSFKCTQNVIHQFLPSVS